MSVGLSLGDIAFVIKFIKGTVFICANSSTTQYKDLIQEVAYLEDMIAEIEGLQCVLEQESALIRLKLAAQRRRRYIQDLGRKLDKFKDLSNVEKTSRYRNLRARLKWNITMASKVPQTRNELLLYGLELRTQQITLIAHLPKQFILPNLRYTWFQPPVVVEDALGRTWPVPSECGWASLRSIISEKFKVGPGASKVAANEYTLFPTGDCSSTFSDSDCLLPGQEVSMAMIISYFEMTSIGHCPTPNCRTTGFLTCRTGEVRCPRCHCSFHFDESSHFQYPHPGIVKERYINSEARQMLYSRMRQVARSTRPERLSFRNVRIFLGVSLVTSLIYGKRCRMLLCNNQWPAEVAPANYPKVREDDSQYANFERYLQSMEEQPGAPELLLEAIARDIGSNVPYVLSQLDSLRITGSASI